MTIEEALENLDQARVHGTRADPDAVEKVRAHFVFAEQKLRAIVKSCEECGSYYFIAGLAKEAITGKNFGE
jgi:hypothetical protein